MILELKLLTKQRGLLLAILIILLLPVFLLWLEGIENLTDAWYGSLQVHMILFIPALPVILHTLWTGKLQPYEKQVVIFYLPTPSLYFFNKLLVTWLVIGGLLSVFYSIFWLITASPPFSVWYATLLQIILTTGLVVTLAGILSLLLKRTIYSIILIILYLLCSIQFLQNPMFALWFNPNFIEEMMLQPNFILQRLALIFWIVLLLVLAVPLFKRLVVS